MDAKVVVVGTLKFAPENIAKIRPHVTALIEPSRLQDGCIAYDVAEDLFTPGVLRVSEIWADQESLQKHVESPEVPAWYAALEECGMIESEYVICDVSGIKVV